MRTWNKKHKPKHWTKPRWSFETILTSRCMECRIINPHFLMALLLKPKYHRTKVLIRKPFKIPGYNC